MSGSWLDALQPASFRGVPFVVKSSEISAGRKTAEHEYPFRDTVWVEDLGRKGRRYGFRGFVVGDDCYAQERAMLAAVEASGPGELVHPSLGSRMVSVVEFTSGQDQDTGRVVSFNFRCVEGTDPLYPGSDVSTGTGVTRAADAVDVASSGDFLADIASALSYGTDVVQGITATVEALVYGIQSAINDPAMLANAVAGLVAPVGYTYGRFAYGVLGSARAGVSTIAQALADVTTARDNVNLFGFYSVVSSLTLDASLAPTIHGVISALRAGIANPADQVRLLAQNIAGITASTLPAISPISVAVQTAQMATAALCRRAALTGIARSCAAYSPQSYQDAVALRQTVTGLFDAEIQVAADAEDVATYNALRALRTAVVLDLNTRAATLPTLIEVDTPLTVPALSLAYRLYTDAGRADDIIARAQPIHPAFMPTKMVLLSA